VIATAGAMNNPSPGVGPSAEHGIPPEFVAAAVRARWHPAPPALCGFEGVGIDSREPLRGKLFVALRGDRHDGHDHLAAAAAAGAAGAIVEREVVPSLSTAAFPLLRVEGSVLALQALAAAWRRALAVVVVGITGSAGKTTTRRLVHAAVSGALPAVQSPKSFNNHLGLPLTLLAADRRHRVVVAEIGMNALGEIATLSDLACPEIGIVTSIGHAHLEGVGSLAGVAREKSDLLRRVRRGACEALSLATADAPALRPYLAGIPGVRLIGESPDASVRLARRRRLEPGGKYAQTIEVIDRERGGEALEVRLRLPGRHNALNALAAIAVARHLGVDDGSIVSGLEHVAPDAMRFEALPLREEPSDEPVLLVNDAYNANPESMAAALATFGECFAGAARRRVLLADMLELGDAGPALHATLGSALEGLDQIAPLERVHLIGPLMAHAAARLTERWGARAQGRVVHHAALRPEVIEGFVAEVRRGDAILLKGSRGMALERVAEALAARFAPDRRRSAAPSV